MKEEQENNAPGRGQNDFALPEGYFRKSAESIVQKIEWTEEHKDFSALLRLKGEGGFVIPENYFEKGEPVLELIDFPVLSSLQKQSGLIAPVNYFENAETERLAEVVSEGINLDAGTLLSSIKKQNSFHVDDNYFAENQFELEALLTEEKKPRVLSFLNLRVSFAAAALLVVALGIWSYNYYFKTVETQDCGTMACLDKNDLVKTRNLENMDDDELFELLDQKSFEEKINKTKGNETLPNQNDTSIKDLATEDLLDEL